MLTAALDPAPGAAKGDFRPYDGPRPLAVWIQRDAWLWVLGSDVPRVALYDDGELVFLTTTGRNRSPSFRHWRLPAPELAKANEKISRAIASKPRPRYELTQTTDSPEAMLYLRSGEHELATFVYGLGFGDVTGLDERDPALPPGPVLSLLRYLAAFDGSDGQPWKPRYLEAMLRPSRGPGVPWPSEWPDLSSDRALRRHDEQASIYLDISSESRLIKLIERLKTTRSSVSLDGKFWGLSVRPVFPSEPVWRAVLFPQSPAPR
jgi:hypothetical protein